MVILAHINILKFNTCGSEGLGLDFKEIFFILLRLQTLLVKNQVTAKIEVDYRQRRNSGKKALLSYWFEVAFFDTGFNI